MILTFHKIGLRLFFMKLENKKINLNKRQDLGELYSFINHNNSKYDGIILNINFFLYPRDILIITQFIIHSIKRKDANYLKIESLENNIQKYLKDIGLLYFCDKNREEPKEIEFIPSRTAMPIRRVTRETMDEYIILAVKYFQEKCPTKELTMLHQCFAELVNNVYDHSQSKIDSYVFCQYYPQKNIIRIGVSDLGIGIFESVNRYHLNNMLETMGEIDSVNWAIKEKSTTKSIPRNKGLGLSNIFTFIKTNSSEITLYTGNVAVFGNKYNTKSYLNLIRPFTGTVIEVELRIDNLPEIEDKFIDFEF